MSSFWPLRQSFVSGRVIAGFMLATIIVSSVWVPEAHHVHVAWAPEVSFVVETLPRLKQRPVRCQELLDAGEALTVEACEPAP